jgi:hypothetical protein
MYKLCDDFDNDLEQSTSATRFYNEQLQLTITVETKIEEGCDNEDDDDNEMDGSDEDGSDEDGDSDYEYSADEMITTICCPEIRSTKLSYLIFCNSCKSKIKESNRDFVQCWNCGTKMPKSQCRSAYSQIDISVFKNEKLVVLKLLPKSHEDAVETEKKNF